MAYFDQHDVEYSDDRKTLIRRRYNHKGGYVIPNGVTSIEYAAFHLDTNLTSIDIPDSVTKIGGDAFEGCTGLTSVFIPDSVTKIGRGAFGKCKNLTAINVSPDNPKYCSIDGVLYNKKITKLIQYPGGKQGAYTIPDSVIEIGDHAFEECTGLTSVFIHDHVTEIGRGAFGKCKNLTAINVSPDNPKYCSIDGVLYNKKITELLQYPHGKQGAYTIPDSVNGIGDHAFEGCTGLTSVFIPDSVYEIGYEAFRKCKNLTAIDVSKDNVDYLSIDGVLFENRIVWDEGIVLLQYPGGKQGAYTIPDSVTEIKNHAFEECAGLTSVTIPDSVTEIGIGAFSDCTGLTSVALPHNITSIEDSTFSGCSKLESITIPDGVTYIGDMAFYECSELESVTIPDSVTYIGDSAFAWCIHWAADFPKSVTYIGSRAFAYTYPDLEW